MGLPSLTPSAPTPSYHYDLQEARWYRWLEELKAIDLTCPDCMATLRLAFTDGKPHLVFVKHAS